jgi:hypothetical protein
VHPDLEAIVAADEDARARVAAAEQRTRDRLRDAEASRDDRLAQRRRQAEEALQAELRSIGDEADHAVEARRQRRLARAEERDRRAEALLPAAVEACLRILGGGAEDGGG